MRELVSAGWLGGAGQMVGDAVRATIWGDPERDRLRASYSLDAKGPVLVEARLPRAKGAQ